MTVYFIQDEGVDIKIGFSERDPMARLSAMQTGNPRELRLLAFMDGSRSTEAMLHEKFSEFRVRGEWFRPEPYLLGFISAVALISRHGEPERSSDVSSFGIDRDHLDRIVGAAIGQSLCDSIEAWCARCGGNAGCHSDAELADGELFLERAKILLETSGEDDRKLGAVAYSPVDYWHDQLSRLVGILRERSDRQ